MKKILWFALLAALLSPPAATSAQERPRRAAEQRDLSAYAEAPPALAWSEEQPSLFTFEQLSISSAAVAVTRATYAGMQACSVTVESNAVRYRPDGVDPTASVGVPVATGSTIVFARVDALPQTKFIRQSADATGWVVCWRTP